MFRVDEFIVQQNQKALYKRYLHFVSMLEDVELSHQMLVNVSEHDVRDNDVIRAAMYVRHQHEKIQH